MDLGKNLGNKFAQYSERYKSTHFASNRLTKYYLIRAINSPNVPHNKKYNPKNRHVKYAACIMKISTPLKVKGRDSSCCTLSLNKLSPKCERSTFLKVDS